jgi:hypothetical protein
MITLTTWADFAELADLIYEMTTEHGLTDDQAFVAACAELPVLLDLPPDARYRPARVVMFDLLSARELKDWTER